jgi:hypothetical protein
MNAHNTAFPQQPLAARATYPSTIRVHRVAFGVLIDPTLRRAIRLTDIGAETRGER